MRRQVCSIAWHIPFKETRYCGTAPSPFLKNRRHLRLSLDYITGLAQILGSKIQDFFQNNNFFFQTQGYQIGDQHDAGTKPFLNKIWPKQKIIKHTKSASRSFEKKTQDSLPSFQTCALFSRLFPGLENCWTFFKTFSRIQDSAGTLMLACIAGTFYARWNVSV